jgi:hypothetical protein
MTSVTATPNMNLSAFQVDDHLVIRVNIEAPASAAGRPINIGLLIDVSGSMDGARIDAVKRTLHAARGLWRAEDRVTLVTFSDRAQVLRDHQAMNEAGLTEFYNAVDAMRADGSTNLSAGIEALYGCGADYDMVLILTDGVLNAGVTSTAGIEAMLNAPGRRTINTYGYGADHCRALLRDLSLRSRGAYTFIDNDEILPVATGDLISGLREEAVRGATLMVPESWTCAELDGGANTFYVGNLVGGRDYWYVFRRGAAAAATAPIRLTAPGGAEAEISVVFADEAPEAREQILRCRVARLMSQMSEALEAGLSLPREAATALKAEIDAAAAEFRARPLVLRLQGQLAELLAMPEAPPPPAMGPMLGLARGGGGGLGRSPAGAMWPGTPAGGTRSLAARLASGMTCLSNQRGVYTGVSESGASVYEEDPDRSISLFSTPSQRSASSQVRDVYSGAASGPPIAPVPAPAPAPAGDPHALPITPQSSQEPDA